MSAAVPVIASNVGGLPEVIRHGENGLLVENDEAAIARAIRQLLDHPEEARQIGDAARRTVMERFTVDRMVAGTLEAYRRCSRDAIYVQHRQDAVNRAGVSYHSLVTL